MTERETPIGQPWKGLDTSQMPVFLGYDQIERMVAALLDSASVWRPDAVVGIARGGLVPAAMAAGILALPLAFISHEKATGAVTWIGPPAAGRRILLVDDCCSSGNTLHRARETLMAEGRECLTLVVVHDPDVAQYLPDLSHPMRALFRLPWERGEATPTGRAVKASGRHGRSCRRGAVRRGWSGRDTPGGDRGAGGDRPNAKVPAAAVSVHLRFYLAGAGRGHARVDTKMVMCLWCAVRRRLSGTGPPSRAGRRRPRPAWLHTFHRVRRGTGDRDFSPSTPPDRMTWWQEGAGIGWTVGAAAQLVFPLFSPPVRGIRRLDIMRRQTARTSRAMTKERGELLDFRLAMAGPGVLPTRVGSLG